MDKNDTNINKVIFSDYLIQKKIGKGSFGTVYSGIVISTNQKVAFKLEKRNSDFPGILETEACRLYLLQGEGIPKIVCYGNNRSDNILIQELLGNSLEEIFNNLNKKFTLKTVCNIGIQLIKRIKHIHKKYHIHRDIKPDNFMTGYYKSDNKIYLIDFGLAKKYYSSSKKQHIKFKAGKNLVGTARYCSRNAHKGYELSRRDDIESIGYCLIYFLKGCLPWQGLKVKKIEEQFNKIAEKKMITNFETLTGGTPPEFLQYFRHCDKLNFEEEPHYDFLIALFKNALSKYCNDNNFLFDWKKKSNLNNNNNLVMNGINCVNSRNISLVVHENNLSNNISAVDSKGEELFKNKKDIKDNNNNVSNIVLDKNILNNVNNKNNNENNNNKQNKEEEKNNGNNNELRQLNSDRFLQPKKIEDYFSEGDFKSEEMSDNNDIQDIEINNDNNNINKDNNINNNINNNEAKIETNQEIENEEINQEKEKNNNIINNFNNFNININVNSEENKENKENKNINSNNNNNNNNNKKKEEKEENVIEYEYGIIDNKSRNRIKKIEGNITPQKDKENGVKCQCQIF